MEVDGMYENTPWERLALYAPWIALGVLVAALLFYMVTRKREAERDPFNAEHYPVTYASIAAHWAALGAALGTIGVLFTIHWRAAHDTYPHDFGYAALRTMAVALVLGMVLWILWRSMARFIGAYTLLTASVAAAIALSAFSRTIIAEGQVTAMVLPIGYMVAAIVAELIATAALGVRVVRREPELHDIVSVVVFLAGAYFMSQKLPVVQFHADSSLYPVTGGFFIVALGRLSRMWVLPRWGALVGAAAAIAIGYMLGHWYGIAIAAVGLSISGALDQLRQPNAEYLPQHSTAA